jgi:hypothetical protein
VAVPVSVSVSVSVSVVVPAAVTVPVAVLAPDPARWRKISTRLEINLLGEDPT